MKTSARKVKKIVFFLSALALFLILPNKVFAVANASFSSYPSEVMIGEEFSASFSVESLEATSSYYLKSRIGLDMSHLTKGQTKSNSGEWLSDGESWSSEKFPVFTTDGNGNVSGSISSRVSLTVGVTGENYFTLRALKVGDSSSEAIGGSFVFLVNPAPTFTPTATLTPTATATPRPTNTPKPTATSKPAATATPTTKAKTPTPTKGKTTPTQKPTPDIEGEVLGEEQNLPEVFPLEVEQEAEEATPSAKTPWWPKVVLGMGLLLLFGSGFYIWYNQLRDDKSKASF